MSVLIHALALHDLAVHTAIDRSFDSATKGDLASGVPNPAPVAPPGLAGRVNTLLAWWKWGSLIGGVFGLVACGAMMAIGRRNRSNLAADGAAGIPWVLAGLTLIALSSGIVAVFV
jgi:hypothetical protein